MFNTTGIPQGEDFLPSLRPKFISVFIGNHNNFVHPMHVHGGPFAVVALDGETMPVSARYMAKTINVGPGLRYDVVWTARRPGKWLIHCHIPPPHD